MIHETLDVESASIRSIDAANRMSTPGAPTAHAPPSEPFQSIVGIRAHVDESNVPRFIAESLREIRAHIEERHIQVVGPPFLVCRPEPSGGVDVEVGWPVRNASGTGRIKAGALPNTLLRPDETGQD